MGLFVYVSNFTVGSKVHTHLQWFQGILLAPLLLKKRIESIHLTSGRAPLLVKYSASHSSQLILSWSSRTVLAFLSYHNKWSFTWVTSSNPHEQTYELHTIIPNLQMQKLKLIEVGELAHRHTVGQWRSQSSSPDLSSQRLCCEFLHHAACPNIVCSLSENNHLSSKAV